MFEGALESQLADLENKIKVMEQEAEIMTSDLAALTSERDQLQVTVAQLQDDLVKVSVFIFCKKNDCMKSVCFLLPDATFNQKQHIYTCIRFIDTF